jgi:hypothetical protein
MDEILASLLPPEQLQIARQQALSQGLLSGGLAMLQASGGQPGQPKPRLSQIIGQAGPVGMQAYQGAFDRTLQEIMLGQKLQEQKRQQDRQRQVQEAVARLAESPEYANNPTMQAFLMANPEKALEMAAKPPETSATFRDYQQAVQQGFQGSFLDYQTALKEAGRSQQIVKVGSDRVGTIPPGFELAEDPQTGALSMRPIPGSPAEREIQEEERKLAQAAESQGAVAGFTLRDARIVSENLDRMADNEIVRLAKAKIPGQPEYRVNTFMDSLRGTVAIEQLLNIKRQGAGLGQVPQAQLDMLSYLMGKLDLGLPKEDLKLIIGDIQTRYREILAKMTPEDRAMIGIADREYNELIGGGKSGRGRGGSGRRPLGDILRGPR